MRQEIQQARKYGDATYVKEMEEAEGVSACESLYAKFMELAQTDKKQVKSKKRNDAVIPLLLLFADLVGIKITQEHLKGSLFNEYASL